MNVGDVFTTKNLPTQAACNIVRAIYAIRNIETGDAYVGSAEHLARRLRHHVNRLRRGIHHSQILQASWTKRGEEVFSFELLAIEMAGGDLLAIEQRFIDEIGPRYNVTAVARNPMSKGAGLTRRNSAPNTARNSRRRRLGRNRGSAARR